MPKPTFSLFLPQVAMSYDMLRERALLAESLGFDGLWLVDHMWPRGMPDLDQLEAWTSIAALAEATNTIRLGVLVTCNSYRNPGILAKCVTTADHVSGGRIELGIGAGWMDEEYRAYGFEFPPIRTRLEQLDEALAILTSLFSEQRTTAKGKHYVFEDAPFNPKPVQKPLPITIGGGGKRVLMKQVARYATRWNCPMTVVSDMQGHRDALAEHCARIGRDPEEIIISEQTCVIVGRDADDYATKRQIAKTMVGGWIDLKTMAVGGTPDQVIEGLRKKMAAGVTDFAIVFGDMGMPDTLELFMTEVAPKLGA